MKTQITSLLVAALVLTPTLASPPEQPNEAPAKDKPEVKQNDTVALGLLLLTAAAVGAYVVIKVHSKHKEQKGPVTLVLQKSTDNVNWTGVATNTVILNGLDPVEFFREVRRDGYSLYRVKVENFRQP